MEKVIFTLECGVKFPKALETKPQAVFLPKQKVWNIYRLLPTHFELPNLQSNLPDHHLATARAGHAAAGRRQSSSCQGPRRRTLTEDGIQVKCCFPVLSHLYRKTTQPSFEPTITTYFSSQGFSYGWRRFTSWSLQCQQFNHLRKTLGSISDILKETQRDNSEDCNIFRDFNHHGRLSSFGVSVYIKFWWISTAPVSFVGCWGSAGGSWFCFWWNTIRTGVVTLGTSPAACTRSPEPGEGQASPPRCFHWASADTGRGETEE